MMNNTTPLDENGNVLQQGDMVLVIDGTSHAYAIVGEIRPGGLIAPSSAPITRDKTIKGMEMPGVIQFILFPISRAFPDPQNASGRLLNVAKVIKPPQLAEYEKSLKNTQ